MAWGSKGEEGGVPRAAGAPSSMSFIGNEVTVTGNVKASGDMHVDGTVEGDLACRALTLGASGRVKGNINVERATLAGTVEGTVAANELTVEKSARISGDVSYGNIAIEAGAKVDGRLAQRGAAASSAANELKLVTTGE
jgi:cytoskeletal protein CcmA (bactofilin family)